MENGMCKFIFIFLLFFSIQFMSFHLFIVFMVVFQATSFHPIPILLPSHRHPILKLIIVENQ